MRKDWASILLGVWMAISPWPLGLDTGRYPHIVYSCILSGALIAGFAFWAMRAKEPEPWREWVVVLLGIWLLIAPNTWDYESIAMTWNNVLVGLGVMIFGMWRVGELTRQQLKR
ncbi:MAG: SPW repeat protein [Gammaproteobacteria bacterium]|nr:SPW repeat protein [Gammaproteobacteria bacterium]NIR84343.1 SPW repeat protein [Gammaproteobacteria bacterium]NIR89859.1 SPW repeat protein [Gammaproteobacteria bacterium]NIU05726.1 SPW repeat protein [Gammaproteobacteria bacterium]NIV52486.1 hypothetical protein [Gammaproteobacteria bacterium]